MNFSNIYLLYPFNHSLEQAIENSAGLLSDEVAASAISDSTVTVADIFRHTRGLYEQARFSANILEPLREALEKSLTDETYQNVSLTRAETLNNLGNILAALGQKQFAADLIKKAVTCFTNALEELDQEKSPIDWAATQYNLGTANQALGKMLDETKPLQAAIDAYTNALMVWSRDKSPKDWMFTMHQLGASLHAHGKLLKGNRQFQKSVVAYKNALAELNADDYAFELTATYNNRGTVLHHLAESEENPERLQEAIRSYEKALTVSMEQQLPIHLSVLCRVNKATANNVIAELTNDALLAEEMADEFEIIVECFPHALQPLCLRHCQTQMDRARTLANALAQNRVS